MYRKKTSNLLRHFDFLILDIICLELSFAISYVLRHGWMIKNSEFPTLYTNVVMVLMLVSLIETLLSTPYKDILSRGHYREFLYTVKHSTIITVMLVLYLYMTQQGESYSRTVFILTWVIDIVSSYIIREIWKWVVSKSLGKDDSKTQSMILLTTSFEARELVENLISYGKGRYHIKGLIIVDKDMVNEKIAEILVVAKKEDSLEYLCKTWVDEVFVSLGEGYEDIEKKIAKDCLLMGITVHQKLAKAVSEPGKVQMVEKMNGYTVLSSAMNVTSITELVIKRIMDIAGSLVGLVLTAILFIFVAPLIYIKSPGPIFFKQWRVGKNGKKFQIYKFRSMYMDAEERKAELMAKNKVKDGMMFKIENDPRIIGGEKGKGIGNFIRNTSIDEFPQFFNILKGDMSLVGTRPPTLDEWEKYELHHRARLAIKPGLTGMWQVSGRSDITDFEEVVKLDTEYILNWSIGKDIKILLKTVLVVFKRDGSM